MKLFLSLTTLENHDRFNVFCRSSEVPNSKEHPTAPIRNMSFVNNDILNPKRLGTPEVLHVVNLGEIRNFTGRQPTCHVIIGL